LNSCQVLFHSSSAFSSSFSVDCGSGSDTGAGECTFDGDEDDSDVSCTFGCINDDINDDDGDGEDDGSISVVIVFYFVQGTVRRGTSCTKSSFFRISPQ